MPYSVDVGESYREKAEVLVLFYHGAESMLFYTRGDKVVGTCYSQFFVSGNFHCISPAEIYPCGMQ